MKRVCFVLAIVVLGVIPSWTQEKVKYGSIPYGITIEDAINRYSAVYAACYELTSRYDLKCELIDFTALRPMFSKVFGPIKTFSMGYTSAVIMYDEKFTRVLVLKDESEGKDGITKLYFLVKSGSTKLFMVERRAGVSSSGSSELTYNANKVAVTERLGNNPQELYGTYDYYSSGSRSTKAFVCMWEKDNENIILYVANNYGNTGGFVYLSKEFWQEYENLYLEKMKKEQESATEAAKSTF